MLRRHASTGLDLARRARLSTRRATRQLSASASSASASVWGPRIALASLPIGTAAGLYLWRKWDSGGQLNNNTTRVEDADSVPRSAFDRQYKLMRSLGKGGFGEVWLAVEKGTGRNVAVKILSLKQLPRSMVEQEITAMRRTGRHHNIVALIDAFWIAPDEDNPFGEAALVMELAAGGGVRAAQPPSLRV